MAGREKPVSQPQPAAPQSDTSPPPVATRPDAATAPESPVATATPQPAPSAVPAPSPTNPPGPTSPTRPAPHPGSKTAPPVAGTPASAARAPTPAAPPVATPATPAAPAPLDLNALEEQLKNTKAIGLFTKISLKNKVDDLVDQFRAYHAGKAKQSVRELRRSYDLLMMKVLSLLQDDDQNLATTIVASREAIWGLLVDSKKFAALQS
jgi:hypothetical protein